jgi:hypothetical protein
MEFVRDRIELLNLLRVKERSLLIIFLLKTNIRTLERQERNKIELFFLQILSFANKIRPTFLKAYIHIMFIAYVNIIEASKFL